jgi:glycosyltransferase involved in cell wall biosynthesis
MTYKPELVFVGPVETASGYGAHARDIVDSLFSMDKFRIKIIPINWGHTPMNALDENDISHRRILNHMLRTPLQSQPDIWVQCTVPNEFQAVGKYNIGITAGVETDICSPEWIDGCNRMDCIIVPSQHSKNVFINTKYEKRDKTTNQQVGIHELSKPVYVIPEGIKTEIYNSSNTSSDIVLNKINRITEDFVFLSVGHWLKGDFCEDRKDISGLIHTFLKTFSDKPNKPALLLKISGGTYSIKDKSNLLEKIDLIKSMIPSKDLPNIYLLHGHLTDSEMNCLYNNSKIKALVSFTKGEGYGRPIAEFMASGKPVLVSNWSGHLDFVNGNYHTLLDGNLKQVHSSAVWEGVINSGTSWFSIDYDSASKSLTNIFENYEQNLQKSMEYKPVMETKWSHDQMTVDFDRLLNDILPKFVQKANLVLPKLSNLQKNNLPKLKKINI